MTRTPADGMCAAPNLLFDACPSRRALDLVADKWAVITLYAIGAGIDRHGELRRAIQGVTQKMLTQTLRDLERDGLIDRTAFDELPPRVHYTVTELGASLLSVVQRLCDWSVVNMPTVESARRAFDANRTRVDMPGA